ncbi:MAG: hypothetical protein JOY57_12580 [Actinobacteria bacterium]|nr:hypothetical protein [Actinomycetota bacterium]
MRIRVLVAVALLVVSAGACSSGHSSKSSGPTTTVEPINPTTTLPPTTVGKTTKTTAPSAAKATTAEVASNRLFDAWKAGNKTAARQIASDAVVNELFSHPASGPPETFQGCDPDAGGFLCSYTYEGGAMQFTVSGSAAAGFKVTKLSYIAD